MSALIHGSIIDDKKRLNYRVTQLFCPLLDGIALNSRGAKIVTTLDFIKNKGSEMSFNTGDAVIHKTDKKQRKVVVVTQVFKETPPREALNNSKTGITTRRKSLIYIGSDFQKLNCSEAP